MQANHAYWAHVGDSRFYLFRQGGLIGATKDHSKVQYLVDQGIIQADEVADHPDRNKIFSCLGGLVDPVIDLSQAHAASQRRHPRAVHRRPVGVMSQREMAT